jgi:hypothetical protein
MEQEKLNKTEIKKLLYKHKPLLAVLQNKTDTHYSYMTEIFPSFEESISVYFSVPILEMDGQEAQFTDVIQSQLLIRWIDKFSLNKEQ